MIRIQDPNVNSTTRTHPRTLNEAFPRAPEWREHKREMDDEDYMVTVVGLACIGFVLILSWLGY